MQTKGEIGTKLPVILLSNNQAMKGEGMNVSPGARFQGYEPTSAIRLLIALNFTVFSRGAELCGCPKQQHHNTYHPLLTANLSSIRHHD
jgi:hypothetical protein